MSNTKPDAHAADKIEDDPNAAVGAAGQAKRSWWYWRRSQNAAQPTTSNAKDLEMKNHEVGKCSEMYSLSFVPKKKTKRICLKKSVSLATRPKH